MNMFEKPEPKNDDEKPTLAGVLDEYDQALEREQGVLQKILQSTERSDDHVMLQHHITETRQVLIALREKIVLSAYYRSRVNK
jgi:hypothetical protein